MPIKPPHYSREKLEFARQLRREQTKAEADLWHLLSNRQLGGFKFRRQQAFGEYVADFLCAQSKLIVELDGDSHIDKEVYDRERTNWFNEQGFMVLRFANTDLNEDIDQVLGTILQACLERQRPLT
jgi:very-short-patch-repair endonuclease